MRPTTSTMLQQNNNNNYPCLNMTGSTRELLQKCSRASLPFPSRLELGLADLPLIRGLRAWALCSKNRRKAGGLLGGGQAPTAPPAGRAGTTSCTRPADVYLSGEWGRMGYGLPLGVDAGQAGIGALVTVATLKTSEGSGKTQTQCLFLRTEKGSCLYSTAKPGSGLTTSAASSVVGGWLRGKTGGGGGGGGSRDTPAGRRDSGPTLPSQTGANRVRVRSGRRWRKSCNASGREKASTNRERQQSSREDPAGEIILEERQEERDKGGLESEQFPSVQQDSSRARQEKEGECTSPKCCHNDSPKACSQCGRRAQRGDSQDGQEGDERRGVPNSEVKGMRKKRQENAEEEEEEERELESSNSVMAAPNPDLESNHLHPESHSDCDVEEIREANEELKAQTSHSKTDTNSEVMKIRSGNKDFIQGQSAQVTPGGNGDFDEELEANVNGFNDHVEADQESEKETESVDVEKEGERVSQAPAELSAGSKCSEFVSDSTRPASISAAAAREPSAPVEGSTCSVDHESCGVQREQENSQDNHTKERQQGALDPGIVGKEEQDLSRLEPREPNCVADENITVNESFFLKNVNKSSQAEERGASASPLRHRDPSLFETGRTIVTEINCSTIELNGAEHRDELLRENRAEESQEENIEARVNPEAGGEAGEVRRRELHDGDGEKGGDSTTQEDDGKEVMRNCALEESWRLQESADGCRGRKEEVGDTSVAHENVTNVPRADHTTSAALSPANPAPSLPPLGSMATGLPCLEAEREEEEEEEEEKGVVVTAGDGEGSREGKRRLEGEEERGATVATEEGGNKEEEEEEDEFGVFMQAEGEPAWSEGSTMSASVPCGSRESAALGNHAITGESTHWTPGWTDSSSDQSDDTWTAFPQDSPDEGRDVVGQWWTTSTVDDSRDRLLANQNLAAAFAEAFPSLPGSSSSDLDTVPTLTQLLRGRASQDQGLLDSFHDLNKMICQRYKRANGVSRDLLLRTLHLERTNPENRPAPRTANRRLSPGLPSANQHAQNAAAKRRLSCDYNRNIME